VSSTALDRARLSAPLPEKIDHLVIADLVEITIAKADCPRLIGILAPMVSSVFSRRAMR
jgi:hypothetical protein